MGEISAEGQFPSLPGRQRITVVSSDADDPILTSAGVATGLNVDVEHDIMPTLGFTYFVSEHWAIEAILGSTKHQISAQGPSTDV